MDSLWNLLLELWGWVTKDAITFFTVILSLFTGVLGATAIAQIKYLRRADETARTSADAAKRAADAASQQASASIEIELPILMIVGIETLDGSTTKLVRIKIKNYGRTPAIITADCLQTRIAKALPIEPRY